MADAFSEPIGLAWDFLRVNLEEIEMSELKSKPKTLIAVPLAASALLLAACGTTVTERAATGALGGAAVGGVVGGSLEGAAVGAAVGGVAGAATAPRR